MHTPKSHGTSYLRSGNILIFMLCMMMFSNLNFIPNQSLVIGVTLISVTLLSIPYLFQKFDVLFKDINMVMIVLFYWSLYTSLWTEYPLTTIQRVFIVFIPTFILLILVSKDENKIKTFISLAKIFVFFFSIIAGIGLVLRLFGNVQYSSGQSIEKLTVGPITIFQTLYGIPPFFRITSITNNPNTLAIWLAFSLTLCVFLYYVGKLSFKTFSINFILQVSALVLTISRSGIASAMISLLLMYAMSKRRRFLYVVCFSVIIIITIMAVTINNDYHLLLPGNYSQLRISTDLNSRQDAWIPLVEYIADNPLLGAGFGVSSEAILQKQGLEIATHNAYLTVFSETGLLGGSLFLLFWIYSIIRSFFLYRNSKKFGLSKEEYFSVLVCLSFQMTLLFHQFFEGKIMRLDLIHFIWLYLIAHVSELYRLKKVEIKDEKYKINPSHHRFKHRRSRDDVI
jgi:O-antigen ligase